MKIKIWLWIIGILILSNLVSANHQLIIDTSTSNNFTLSLSSITNGYYIQNGGSNFNTNPGRIIINISRQLGKNASTSFMINWQMNESVNINGAYAGGPFFMSSNGSTIADATRIFQFVGNSDSRGVQFGSQGAGTPAFTLFSVGATIQNVSMFVNFTSNRITANLYVNGTFIGNMSTNDGTLQNTMFDYIMFANDGDNGHGAAFSNFTFCNSNTTDIGCTNHIGVVAPTDTIPPQITLINLTDRQGVNQVINFSNQTCSGAGCSLPKLSNLTPTFSVITNENSYCAVIDSGRNLNWTDIYRGNQNNDSVAPSLNHTLTLNTSNQTSIGLRNFSIGCKDTAGNENLSSSSGLFTINITSSAPPNISIFAPQNNSYFVAGSNISLSNTLQFNWSATDDIDNFISNCSVYISGILAYNTTNYKNGTLFLSNISGMITGTNQAWYANCTDSDGNTNQSLTYYFTIVPPINTLNITFYDEILGIPISFNKTTGQPITLELASNTFSSNYSISNDTFFNNTMETGEYRAGYIANIYRKRYSYFTIVNNTINNLALYLLSIGNGTITTFTITDQNANVAANLTIKAQRYYVPSNTYETIAMARTDATGLAVFDLQQQNAFYSFIISDNTGKILLNTIPAAVYASAYSLSVNTGTTNSFNYIRNVGLYTGKISFSNITNSLSFLYNDASGTSKQVCLIVNQVSLKDGEQNLCNVCSSSTSATLVCNVSDSYNANNTIIAKAYAYSTASSPGLNTTSTELDEITLIAQQKIQQIKDVFGLAGVFLAFAIVVTMVMIGLWHPVVAMLLGTLGFIGSYMMGIITLGTGSIEWLVGIVILAGIIAYRSG